MLYYFLVKFILQIYVLKDIFVRAFLSVMLFIISLQRENALFAYIGGKSMNEFEESVYKKIKSELEQSVVEKS